MRQGKLNRLMADPASSDLLRGEVWISLEVLAATDFDQGPKGLVNFASSLGADVCFFHWPESVLASDLKKLTELAHGTGLDCGLTIDGPFQRLTAKKNILDILQELGRNPSVLQRLLAREMEEITGILSLIEQSEIDLILIGEDLGCAGGLYFSPEVFRSYLFPYYQDLRELCNLIEDMAPSSS